MAYTMTDIKELYKIKCKKYKAEELTVELKTKLVDEAIEELRTMEEVNKSGSAGEQ